MTGKHLTKLTLQMLGSKDALDLKDVERFMDDDMLRARTDAAL
jgi:hypothetical protein